MSNPEKREIYDRHGLDGIKEGGAGPGNYFNGNYSFNLACLIFSAIFKLHFLLVLENCSSFSGGGFGGASMFEDLFGGFFGFPGSGMAGGGRGKRRGEDTLHPLRFGLVCIHTDNLKRENIFYFKLS